MTESEIQELTDEVAGLGPELLDKFEVTSDGVCLEHLKKLSQWRDEAVALVVAQNEERDGCSTGGRVEGC